jgi:hypothetical protein
MRTGDWGPGTGGGCFRSPVSRPLSPVLGLPSSDNVGECTLRSSKKFPVAPEILKVEGNPSTRRLDQYCGRIARQIVDGSAKGAAAP